MIKFLCPFLVTDLSQIPGNLIDEYDLGLEGVIFDGKDLSRNLPQIKRNLEYVMKQFPERLKSLHYPTENADYFNLSDHYTNLTSFLRMAHDLKVHKVVLHSNYFVASNRFDSKELVSVRGLYRDLLTKLDDYLDELDIELYVENMPIIGNEGKDFDSIFVLPEDFDLFEEYRNIKVAWDFGHWSITYVFLKDVKRVSSRTSCVDIEFNEYQKINNIIAHSHFSSFAGNTFINADSLCKEGVPPSKGDVDEMLLIGALTDLSNWERVICVSLEINEIDYNNRIELSETLEWLKVKGFIATQKL